MALTIIEHLSLWGPPILALLLAAGYYLRWGKEAEENRDTGGSQPMGGEG